MATRDPMNIHTRHMANALPRGLYINEFIFVMAAMIPSLPRMLISLHSDGHLDLGVSLNIEYHSIPTIVYCLTSFICKVTDCCDERSPPGELSDCFSKSVMIYHGSSSAHLRGSYLHSDVLVP